MHFSLPEEQSQEEGLGGEVFPEPSKFKTSSPEAIDATKTHVTPEVETVVEAESRGGRIPAQVGVEKL